MILPGWGATMVMAVAATAATVGILMTQALCALAARDVEPW
jgi:hypothetical protein